MEKLPIITEEQRLSTRSGRRRNHRRGLVLLAILCSVLALSRQWWQPSAFPWISSGSKTKHEPHPSAFDWQTAPSSSSLEYGDCYAEFGNYTCARLDLPMDYWNDTTHASIQLAVIRKPAQVAVTDSKYGGAVLLNPGGPGGSGISLVLGGGKHISETIDDADGKYYDLISFDPRGVGHSTPRVKCSDNGPLTQSWQVRVMEEGILGSSDASIGRLWSMAIARAAGCSLPREDGQPDIKEYVSTASVARDMLEIVEKHGQWRESEARRLLTKGRRCGAAVEVPEALVHHKGEERIQYWGFSYGTYLGLTYAAMFPDQIHRLVVDGVVDTADYLKTLWYDNLVDTEKVMDQFYYHCARVGYPTCALANETTKSTPEGVRERILNITMSLYHNPLPVIGPYPEVIEYSDIKNLIFAAVYSPVKSFAFVANLLWDVENGIGTRFANLLKPYHDFFCPATNNGHSIIPLRNYSRTSSPLDSDATMAIACSDGDSQAFLDRSRFEDYYKKLSHLSPSIGAMWATIRMHCVHYSVRAHHRFTGPWTGKTSHPILLLGNTADPVTPGINAINAAKSFEGSVALIQNASGHCSSSAYSKCTTGYIRKYFQSGELPPMNTTCEADEVPFGPGPDEKGVEVDGQVKMELMRAKERMSRLHSALHAAGGWVGELGFE